MEIRHAFDPPPGAKIWNPVKLKMQQGGKVTGGTLFSATDPATYCAMANAGYDFIWTEMQHDQRDWGSARACGGRVRMPRRFLAFAWPIAMNARSSTRWMPARS